MSLADNLLLGFAVASLLISIGAVIALIVMQPGLCFVVVAGVVLASYLLSLLGNPNVKA